MAIAAKDTYELINFREALGMCFAAVPELKGENEAKTVTAGTVMKEPGNVKIYKIYLGSDSKLLTEEQIENIRNIAKANLPPPSVFAFFTKPNPDFDNFYSILSALNFSAESLKSVADKLTTFAMPKGNEPTHHPNIP